MQERSDLCNKLDNLPLDWEAAKTELIRLKMGESAAKADLENAELDIINANGGYKGLGSNDKERDAALAGLKRTNAGWNACNRMVTAYRLDCEAQTVVVERIEKQLQAVGYQSRILAGLFNYLGSAGVPVLLPEGEEVELNGFGI
ncbi:MAG: hypothetical protein ACOYD4_11755 [Solirubrobacterales bacterium]